MHLQYAFWYAHMIDFQPLVSHQLSFHTKHVQFHILYAYTVFSIFGLCYINRKLDMTCIYFRFFPVCTIWMANFLFTLLHLAGYFLNFSFDFELYVLNLYFKNSFHIYPVSIYLLSIINLSSIHHLSFINLSSIYHQSTFLWSMIYIYSVMNLSIIYLSSINYLYTYIIFISIIYLSSIYHFAIIYLSPINQLFIIILSTIIIIKSYSVYN